MGGGKQTNPQVHPHDRPPASPVVLDHVWEPLPEHSNVIKTTVVLKTAEQEEETRVSHCINILCYLLNNAVQKLFRFLNKIGQLLSESRADTGQIRNGEVVGLAVKVGLKSHR